MISYIFKDKIKNILMIIFTCLHILNTNIPYEFYLCISQGSIISVDTLLHFLSFVLILVYMFTLKIQYRFKEWLFPAAFAISGGLVIYDIIFDIVYSLTQYGNLSLVEILSCTINAVSAILLALCFCGSIKNFKNAIFLKIGTLAMMIYTVVITITDFILVGGAEYFSNIPQEYLTSVYISMGKALIKLAMILLYYFGIFNLTLNKKANISTSRPTSKRERQKKRQNARHDLHKSKRTKHGLTSPYPKYRMALGAVWPAEKYCPIA